MFVLAIDSEKFVQGFEFATVLNEGMEIRSDDQLLGSLPNSSNAVLTSKSNNNRLAPFLGMCWDGDACLVNE